MRPEVLLDAPLAALAATLMGIYALLRGPRDPRNINFAGFVFTCAVISISSMLVFTARDLAAARTASLWTCWLFVYMPAFLLSFCLHFGRVRRTVRRPLIIAVFAASTVLSVLSFSPWMVTGFVREGAYVKPQYGIAYWAWILLLVAASLGGFTVMMRRLRHPDAYLKNRVRLFLFGLGLGLGLGTLSFFLMHRVNYPLTTLAILTSMPIMALSFMKERLWSFRSFFHRAFSHLLLGGVVLIPIYLGTLLALGRLEGGISTTSQMVVALALGIAGVGYFFPSRQQTTLRTIEQVLRRASNIDRRALIRGSQLLMGMGSVEQVGSELVRRLELGVKAERGLVFVDECRQQGLLLVGSFGAETGSDELDQKHPGISWLLGRDSSVLRQDLESRSTEEHRSSLLSLMTELGVELAVPFHGRDDLQGVILLGPLRSGDIYEPSDLEIIEVLASSAGSAMGSAVLFEEQQVSRDIEHVSLWVASIAHEFRNSLIPARMFLELFEQRKDDPEYNSTFRRQALEQLQRSFRIIGELQQLHHDRKPARAPHDLCALVRGAAGSLEPEAERKDVALEVRLPAEPVVCCIDSDQVTQALVNLILNGIAHAGANPVEVELLHKPESSPGGAARAVVLVSNGMVIEPEILPHIFTPFFSTREAINRHHQGSGLGLPIAQRIVHAHDGSITVHSSQRKGTTFTISFPMDPWPEGCLEERPLSSSGEKADSEQQPAMEGSG